jgi:hypothetical protein
MALTILMCVEFLEQGEEAMPKCEHGLTSKECYVCASPKHAEQAEKQEPVAWRNAALRVGEDLCSVGPFGYYDMTAEQWLDWALSVVTVHAPPPPRQPWVGLTEDEIGELYIGGWANNSDFARAIEDKLRSKNQ